MHAASQWGIHGFVDHEALIDAWQAGDIQLDYAIVTTPNNHHFAQARACIEAGLPVLCEKPMTITVGEAKTLRDLVQKHDVPFVLAHTYTGHPMVMLAREMIKRGDIGEVRKIDAWYNQGWLATLLEKEGQPQAVWRADPSRAGASNCGGDIGTHALIAASWVTRLHVSRVSARVSTLVKGRTADDDFNVIAEMENGATALIVATQIAIGYKNDHGFRIFGSKGSIEWHQERAEKLLVRRGSHDEVYWLGANFDFFPDSIASYLRIPAGHNEDFFEALANLHMTLELRIRKRRGEDVSEPYDHPGVQEGVSGMKFVRAALDSSAADGAWMTV